LIARCIRLALAAAALAAVAASPAGAHNLYPDHEYGLKLPFEATLLGTDLAAPLQVSGPAKCQDGMAGVYPCENVDLEGFVPLPVLGGATGNDIWGWTDPKTGSEYALMGTSTSTGFVDVTDPQDPKLLGFLPTQGTPDMVLWRDIKVDGHYAFIVSEVTGSGMQVFDLHRLRDAGDTPQVFTEDAFYAEVSNTHNISINTATDFAYLVGTNTCEANGESGGLHMVDISKPLEPKFAGCATVDEFAAQDEEEPNNYVHDVECVVYDGPDGDYQGREICFGSNENTVAIYDVTDKKSPRVISTTTYDTAAYTHQGSLTEDKRFFLFGDELDEQEHGVNTTTYILDVSDLDAPPTPKAFTHESVSIDHNMYVHDGRVYQSNYAEGLRILDVDNAALAAGKLDEVGYFDVVPGLDYPEFAGTWSNYMFPSGTIVVSAIENHVSGLFVLRSTLPQRGGSAPGGSAPGGPAGGPTEPAAPSAPAGSADRTKPKLNLRLKRVQDLDRLAVKVTPDEESDVTATAVVSTGKAARVVRFKPASRRVGAGQRAKLRLKLGARAERRVRRALRRGKRLRAGLTVSGRDMSGNAIAKKRRVRLTR
jgi:choice-of-anchor B domain-containing protein